MKHFTEFKGSFIINGEQYDFSHKFIGFEINPKDIEKRQDLIQFIHAGVDSYFTKWVGETEEDISIDKIINKGGSFIDPISEK